MLYCFRFHSLSVEPCACFLCVSLVECCWEITGRGGKDIYRHLNVALRHMWSTYAAHYCFYSVTQSSSLPSVSLSLFPGYFTSLYDNWGDYDGWMWDDMSSCVNSQVDWNKIVFQILTAYHQIRNKSVVKYKTKMFHFSLFFCFASMGPIPIFYFIHTTPFSTSPSVASCPPNLAKSKYSFRDQDFCFKPQSFSSFVI